MSEAIKFCIETVRMACELPEPAAEAAAELARLQAVERAAQDVTQTATRWTGVIKDTHYYKVSAEVLEALAAALAAQ